MQNVMIITQVQSYLLVSLREWFEKAGYNVCIIKADIDVINMIEDPIDAIVLYVDEKMLDEQMELTFIRDKAVENDIPVFAIGDPNELSVVEKMISKNLIRREFSRPINVTEVVNAVTMYVNEHSKKNKKKILVVDDSGAMLRNVKGWLEESYQVALANSGAMAIKYLATNRPDLVLLDYEMPIVDGKQVLEMIRSEMEFRDIPVVFLTNKGDKETIMKVMSLKPQGYLLKSTEPGKIVEFIENFFEERRRKELLNM